MSRHSGRYPLPRRFLPYQNGIPSHDTMCDVFAAIDSGVFRTCFLGSIEDLRAGVPKVIAIDGKTSRRSHDHAKGQGCSTLSIWRSRQLSRECNTWAAIGIQRERS